MTDDDDHDDVNWKQAVTLREFLYRIFKYGNWETDPTFRFYLRFFGNDTVREWITLERMRDRETKQRGEKIDDDRTQ